MPSGTPPTLVRAAAAAQLTSRHVARAARVAPAPVAVPSPSAGFDVEPIEPLERRVRGRRRRLGSGWPSATAAAGRARRRFSPDDFDVLNVGGRPGLPPPHPSPLTPTPLHHPSPLPPNRAPVSSATEARLLMAAVADPPPPKPSARHRRRRRRAAAAGLARLADTAASLARASTTSRGDGAGRARRRRAGSTLGGPRHGGRMFNGGAVGVGVLSSVDLQLRLELMTGGRL